jgi:hypothetical protein
VICVDFRCKLWKKGIGRFVSADVR